MRAVVGPAALEGSQPEFRLIDPLCYPTEKVKLPKRKICLLYTSLGYQIFMGWVAANPDAGQDRLENDAPPPR